VWRSQPSSRQISSRFHVASLNPTESSSSIVGTSLADPKSADLDLVGFRGIPGNGVLSNLPAVAPTEPLYSNPWQ
jgi:hypothetical protein